MYKYSSGQKPTALAKRQPIEFRCKAAQLFELENVAIANALQLEAARATSVLSRFNYDAMTSLKSLNLSIAVL